MKPASMDLAPLGYLLLLVLALGALVLTVAQWRHREATPAKRLKALALLAVVLCFDLVVFGSFTRLTDSGLGCPDWPGCYGEVTPHGAKQDIQAAQDAMPTGPVTHQKAWIEMIHRYLAGTVGLLIIALLAMAWRAAAPRTDRTSPRQWAGLALAWVLVQGAFGYYTVALKLYPLVVSVHLLGGLGLLGVLYALYRSLPGDERAAIVVSGGLRKLTYLGMTALLLQVCLGAWVSTNYAVTVCAEFPMCQGQWWPAMAHEEGFRLMRHLGTNGQGGYLSVPALTAIHVTHRLGAMVVLMVLGAWCWNVWRHLGDAGRRHAAWVGGLLALQVVTGISNAVLGWPLAAGVLHSAGAAALLLCLLVFERDMVAASVPSRMDGRSES